MFIRLLERASNTPLLINTDHIVAARDYDGESTRVITSETDFIVAIPFHEFETEMGKADYLTHNGFSGLRMPD